MTTPLIRHVDHSTDAVALLHDLKGLVDLRELLAVGDELVNLDLAVEIIVDKTGKLRAALDATEGGTPPDTAGD